MASALDKVQRSASNTERNLAWIPDEIMNLPFFYPNLSASDAASNYVKNNSSRAGSFILRPSSKGKGCLTFTISVSTQNVNHIQLYVDTEPSMSYYLIPQLKFSTIEKLLAHYFEHRIGNEENVENVRLLHPISKRQRSISLPETNRFGGSRSQDKRKSSFPWQSRERIVDRPPLPLPPLPAHQDEVPYYSHVHDTDRLAQLKNLLLTSETCDCGLLMSDADLGHGWTVHRSKESLTFGKLFYQNEKGLTAWQLPESVRIILTQERIECLKKLYAQNNMLYPYTD